MCFFILNCAEFFFYMYLGLWSGAKLHPNSPTLKVDGHRNGHGASIVCFKTEEAASETLTVKHSNVVAFFFSDFVKKTGTFEEGLKKSLG